MTMLYQITNILNCAEKFVNNLGDDTLLTGLNKSDGKKITLLEKGVHLFLVYKDDL